MKLVPETVFHPLRKEFDEPIRVNSFFRSVKLNKAIGGSRTSQHCKGEALDLDQDYRNTCVSNRDIYFFIKDNLDFDQLIWEGGNDDSPAWVHVSFSAKKNRKQLLRI